VDNGYPVSDTFRLHQPPLTGPTHNQASALPPRTRERGGDTGLNGCTNPWGHAANGPAQRPWGREPVSLPLGGVAGLRLCSAGDMRRITRVLLCTVIPLSPRPNILF